MILAAAALMTAPVPVARAQSDDERRPKIGLALSGGGAKGAAHVGVLKVLEELHVPIDYITGTSMGSIVGGLYASGMTAEELERELTEVPWDAALDDRPPREDLAWRRKEDDWRYLADYQVGVGRKGIKFPPGLRSGQKLYFILQTMCLRAGAENDFDKLPIPFRAVATDIAQGEEVVLDHGNLAEALRASMAIPSAFTPVEIEGKLLVDGGITNNLPVMLAREMGADIVIAVDLGAPLDAQRVENMLQIYGQLTRMLIRKNVEEQLAGADVVVHPPVAHFGTMGFKHIVEILDVGEATAREMSEQLARFSIDEAAYRRHREGQLRQEGPRPVIDYVRISGNRIVDERVIRAQMRTPLGHVLDFERLFKDVSRIYGLGDFQQVGYGIERAGERTGLVIQVIEKPWGPNYVNFGFRVESNLESDLRLGVSANLTATRLNARGAEWRNDIVLGTRAAIFSEIYQPFTFDDSWFAAGSLAMSRDRTDLWEDGDAVAEQRTDLQALGVDVGHHFGKLAELRVGVLRGVGDNTVVKGTAPPGVSLSDVDFGGPQWNFTYDRLDNVNLPKQGMFAFASGFYSREGFGAEVDYDRYHAGLARWWTTGKHTALASLETGWNPDQDLPSYDVFTLGGFFSLGGFAPGELRGQYMGVARAGYMYNVFGSFELGGWYEAGNVWQERSDYWSHPISAGTAFLGADTAAGPVYIAYGLAEGGRSSFYLALGRVFGVARLR